MVELARHVRTTIRYDGPALAHGEMDVQDLAPALLALAEIAKIANRKFNGDRATIKILVNADIEHRCFQVDLSLVQSLLDQARSLIGDDGVVTVEQLAFVLDWTMRVSFVGGGLFAIYKWAFSKGDAQPSITILQQIDARSIVILQASDGTTFEADPMAWELAKDPAILPQMKTVVAPLSREGYTDFEVVSNGNTIVSIDERTAKNIRQATGPVTDEDEDQPFVSPVDGQVEIHTAQFRGTAQWGLWWTGRVRLMKIEDEDWLRRYQAAEVPEAIPGAWLDVAMEITQPRDRKLPASFVVKHVKGVLPPEAPQASMFDDDA